MEYTLRENPSEDDKNSIRARLLQYNRQFLEIEDEYSYIIEAKSDLGELAGSIMFTVCGQWLNIQYLWVHESERGKDIGTRLLGEAEKKGKEHGCRHAYLTTFSFQARPFYEKHGYQVVYTQKNYPITNEKYHMEKSLEYRGNDGGADDKR